MRSRRHAQRSNRRERHSSLLFIVATFLLFIVPTVNGQDSEVPLSLPISLSDIPAQASSESALFEQSERLLSRAAALEEIENALLAQERAIVQNLISLKASLAAASSRDALSEIEQMWQELSGSLEISEKELQSRNTGIERQLALVSARHDVWLQTLMAAEESDAPAEIITLAKTTADELAKTVESLEHIRDQTLALQGKVGRSRTSVQEALDQISAEESDLLQNLTHRERPPLWGETLTGLSATELGSRAGEEIKVWWSGVYSVVRNEADRIVFQLIILVAVALILGRARSAARTWATADPSLVEGMSVFERPVALAAFIALLLTPWLYVSTPPAIDDTVGLLLVLPVMRLIVPLLDKPVRPALYMLAALYVIDWLRDLVEAAPLVARVVFLVELLVAIAIIIWLVRSNALRVGTEADSSSPWRNRIRFGLDIALFLLVAAGLAAISGFVRLAVLIGAGVLNSAYLALMLAALISASDAIVTLALHSRAGKASKVIENRAKEIRMRARGLIAIAAVLIWLLLTLDFFAVRDYVLGFIGEILFAELRAGALAISLADVLAFGLTIFAALLLARIVTTILNEDVFTRVEMGRGVPFAISSVVKYGIVTLGFILAVGAMGMGMDKITILLGALGVGLGFGLQNVVNNFVSGLILIFERPVQIGDSIEVDSVSGTIKRLGIRSTTVRSFEGADITIPNGTLLSDALKNWTMSDRTRRIEVSVGVAYGTNPDEVIEVLSNALSNQEGLLETPEPQVLFTGFGDSSLDFALRAWVEDNDLFVKIRSQVALAINRGLEERGIEIPFPQRDLHVRSVAHGILPG